jgi:hypothetical protein
LETTSERFLVERISNKRRRHSLRNKNSFDLSNCRFVQFEPAKCPFDQKDQTRATISIDALDFRVEVMYTKLILCSPAKAVILALVQP